MYLRPRTPGGLPPGMLPRYNHLGGVPYMPGGVAAVQQAYAGYGMNQQQAGFMPNPMMYQQGALPDHQFTVSPQQQAALQMQQIQAQQQQMGLGAVQRHADLSVSAAASPFGCCNYFDLCTEDIFALTFAGQLGLLDAMGFEPTDNCYESVEFLTYNRPAFVDGSATVGHLSNPCLPPAGIDYGLGKISVEDFGLYGRTSKTRNILKPERRCQSQPLYRLNGQRIMSENEWDMILTMGVLLDDIRRDLITGDATTPGQFDGLERWVTNTYTDEILNSLVVDWNGNDMNGTGGGAITWNGNPMVGSPNLVDLLLDANTQINQRISWSPALQSQNLRLGQKFLLMPYNAIRCLLDFYTCWSVCGSGQTVDSVDLRSLEARQFRQDLNGGLFGFGFIELDGEVIPILPYDWSLIKGPTTFDMYLITVGVGAMRFWRGQFLSAEAALQRYLSDDSAGLQEFMPMDQGRVLVKKVTDELCRAMHLWMSLRLFCTAPWAQVRIADAVCRRPLGFISPDPLQTSYYPQKTFNSATCPA